MTFLNKSKIFIFCLVIAFISIIGYNKYYLLENKDVYKKAIIVSIKNIETDSITHDSTVCTIYNFLGTRDIGVSNDSTLSHLKIGDTIIIKVENKE